jgi:hypothetical protein
LLELRGLKSYLKNKDWLFLAQLAFSFYIPTIQQLRPIFYVDRQLCVKGNNHRF